MESTHEDVLWFQQTINDACGLYVILHAVCNGDAKNLIQPEFLLENILETCLPLNPSQRALALENSKELEAVYALGAMKGDTPAPTNAEDEVDFHFVCFVKSNGNARVYELIGDRTCPIDKGIMMASDDDMLSKACLGMVREFIQQKKADGSGFNLVALAPSQWEISRSKQLRNLLTTLESALRNERLCGAAIPHPFLSHV